MTTLSWPRPHAIEVLWNPIDDDFQPKPPEVFQRGVDFATEALEQDGTKLFIHCAAGVHRAPMMTLAVLCSMGWEPEAAQDLIEKERPVVDFADVYLRSVERFLDQQVRAGSKNQFSVAGSRLSVNFLVNPRHFFVRSFPLRERSVSRS